MPSQRKKLSKEQNVNDSKNTRLDIGLALQQMDLRADYIAHMSRYCKIAELMVDEAKLLGRPIQVFEAGCGELWPIRYLYKALQVKKSEVLAKYIGFDIDENIPFEQFSETGWFKIFNTEIYIQDLTVEPQFELGIESQDMFITTEVIEHMKPEFVEPWIKDAARCLTKNGLAYISTPNSDGSKEKLPLDHVYEWKFQELKHLLEKYFIITECYGTFIQLPKFAIAEEKLGYWMNSAFVIRRRFDKNWQRVILAAPYPEYANNVVWTCRKKP